MSRLRRRVVLGLSAVTVVTLATATPALRRQGLAREATERPAQGAAHGRLGRCGLLGRPRRQPGRHRRPAPGRQRRRRGRRHRGRARGHRALLAPASAAAASSSTTTRRPSRVSDHRRPRDGTGDVHRTTFTDGTGRRWTSTPSSTPGSRSASRAHRPCGTRRPRPSGRCARDAAPAGREPRHPRLHRRPDLLPTDRGQRGPVRASSRPRAVFLPGGNRAAGRLDLPQSRPGHALHPAAAPRHSWLYNGKLGDAIVAEAKHRTPHPV